MKNKRFYIYKISFPKFTKKVYIGKTNNPTRRFTCHKFDAKNGKSTAIHRAMRKYRIENTKFEIIASCLEYTNECAEYCEKQLIKQYNSFGKNGYNMCEGGEGSVGYHHNKSAIEKIGKSSKGQIISDEHKKILSEIRMGENNFMFGKRGKENHFSHHWQTIKKDGKIDDFYGLYEYSKQNGYNPSLICAVYHGTRKSHKDIIKVNKLPL